jgi:aquaporin Z
MADEPAASQYLAEFIGTYLLVFTVGCNVIDGSPIWAVTSIACVLMVSIYSLGNVSGANFNPAVTLAVALSGGIAWLNAAIYMLVQLLGGFCAALTYYGLYGKTFPLGPGAGFSWTGVFVAETLYTFMLCFVVLNVACAEKTNSGNQFFGLAIGFVIVAGGYAVGGISGGAFNPAVAFGIDVIDKNIGARWCGAYMLFEFLGAILAAALFRLVRPEEFGTEMQINKALSCLLSEFLGTFILVVTVGFNVLGGSAAPAFSIAASLMCMIYALGNVSGAHFNPAVTLAILLSGRGKMNGGLGMAAGYMVVQILGGICAGLVYANTMGKAFALGPVEPYGWPAAACAEIAFTFVLCFVVLSVATITAPCKDMFGLAIGSCVTVGGYAIGAVSGGSLNPAVSVGIDFSNFAVGDGKFFHSLAYTGLEFVGAAIAVGLFYITRPGEYTKGLSGLPLFRVLAPKKEKLDDEVPLVTKTPERVTEATATHFFIGDDEPAESTTYGSI